MVDLSKFTFNKINIEWNGNLYLQPNLLLNFIQSFNYVRPKKHLGWSQLFIYLYKINFFSQVKVVCDNLDSTWSCS